MAEIEAVPDVAESSNIQTDSMQEYYDLQRQLLITTLVILAIVFGCVWYFYSLAIALNYLIGGCTGAVYLRMLGKSVEQLGRQRKRLGNTRLLLLVGLIIVASRWHQLEIIPIFLGFLTYKLAVIAYVLQTTLKPSSH
ncbi:MAG: ATP synthase subunit I [Cyanobacteria bacterium]|nr:ATP synthase subunit I [Cyanobacteriota bacterium]MDW8201982.1 ATP synthase subunit I [Cyanobacteriota bacterium SKYGB_h_bin112]